MNMPIVCVERNSATTCKWQVPKTMQLHKWLTPFSPSTVKWQSWLLIEHTIDSHTHTHSHVQWASRWHWIPSVKFAHFYEPLLYLHFRFVPTNTHTPTHTRVYSRRIWLGLCVPRMAMCTSQLRFGGAFSTLKEAKKPTSVEITTVEYPKLLVVLKI